MDEVDRLMTTADVSRRLGVVPNRVRQITDAGELPSVRTVSGLRLYKRADVEQIAAARAASTDRRVTKPVHTPTGEVTA